MGKVQGGGARSGLVAGVAPGCECERWCEVLEFVLLLVVVCLGLGLSDFGKIRSLPVVGPVIAKVLDAVFDPTSGHVHNGSDSRALAAYAGVDDVTIAETTTTLLLKVKDGALSANSAGRAKMADAFFAAASMGAGAGGKFAANSLTEAALVHLLLADGITNAVLIQAILDGAFQADAATRALFADRVWTWAKVALRTVEAHTAGDTLLVAEANSIHTNAGASGTIVIILPAATVGQEYEFAVGAAFELRIDPNGTETIALPSTGAQGGAGKYLVADAVGEWVRLKCVVAGTWTPMGYFGTWTSE